MTAATAVPEGPSVRFGRRERRGILLGLGAGQLVVLAVATFVAITGVYTNGGAGLAASAVLWGPLLVLALASAGGRPLVEWVPLSAAWGVRRLTGAREVALPVPRRSLELPGVGTIPVVATPALGAALLIDRRGGAVTAMARVSGRGFALDDSGTQGRKVDGWGRALAAIGRRRTVRRVQLVLRTTPAGDTAAHRWWRENAVATDRGRGPSWRS